MKVITSLSLEFVMRLFVACDVLREYSFGAIVVIAPDAESVVDVLRAQGEFDIYNDEEFQEDVASGTFEDVGEAEGPARLILAQWGSS